MSGHDVGMAGGRFPAPLRRWIAVGLTATVAAAGLGLARPVGAQDAPTPTSTTLPGLTSTTTTTLPLPDDPSEIVPPVIDPEEAAIPPAPPAPGLVDGRDPQGRVQGPSDALLVVPLSSGGYDAAESIRRGAIAELSAARGRLADLEAQIATLEARQAELAATEAEVRARRDEVAAAHAEVLHDLRTIAVARYVTDGVALEELQADLALRGMEDRRVTSTMADEAVSISSRRATDLGERLDQLDRRLDEVVADLEAARKEARAAADRRPGLETAVKDGAARVTAAEATVGRTRSTALVAGSDINFTALDAYWRAARTMRVLDPTCRLDWWGLAGIGRSESRHGVHAGAVPNSDGTPVAPIIGIPLDGTRNTRVIRDSDGGLLDGDPVFDRAVGPMQFIPSTWRRWAADGSGDGIADPQNFYDATLTAARYLCAGGRILDTDAGLMAGYLSYNRDLGYMRTVLGWARAYQLLPVPSVLG